MKSNYKSLGELIERIDRRNTDGTVTNLIGVSIDKKFIPSVANVIGTDLTKYKIIEKYDFAVSLMQVSRDEKIPVACQTKFEKAIMSPAYPIFRVKDTNIILPEYLEMWFMRSEFDREASFVAVGGVRGSMPWEDFAKLKLPVPDIKVQQEIVKNYKSITDRIELKKKINDNLEAQAKTAFEEAIRDNEVQFTPIKAFGEVITGKTPPTSVPEYYGNEIPFIKTPDMHGNVFITTSNCSLSKAGANSQINKYIPANSVVVACIGANAGEVSLTSYLAQTNQQINSVITPYPCFLYFSIKAHTDELRALGDGSSTMLNINKTSFENYAVLSLENTGLSKLESQLHSILELILQNSREIDKLEEVKDLLVTQLSR